MEIAHYPKDCSESLASAMAIAGLNASPVDDIATIGQVSLADISALIVELGEEPMRRLRYIDALVEESGIPVLGVVEPAHFQLVEVSKGLADIITAPADPAELGLRVRRLSLRFPP